MKKFILITSIGLVACSNNETSSTQNIENTDTTKVSVINSTKSKSDSISASQQRKFVLNEVSNDAVLIASGTEPGWVLTIFENKFQFVGNYGEDTLNGNLNINVHQLPIKYSSKEISFLVEQKKCTAISGDVLDISVEVNFNQKKLLGCGKFLKH
jgi:uncharacterized membrane protein